MALAHDLETERARSAALTSRMRDAFGRILQRVDAVLAAPTDKAVAGVEGAPERAP